MKKVIITLTFKDEYSEVMITEERTGKEIKTVKVGNGNEYCFLLESIHREYEVVRED